MTEFGERIYEDAYALGRANARVIELARRHCLDMAFTEASGHGLAEQQSGLPNQHAADQLPGRRGQHMGLES